MTVKPRPDGVLLNDATSQRVLAIEEIIDLDRYPIHDLESRRGKELIDRAKADLVSAAALCLPGFLRADAAALAAAQVAPLAARGFRHSTQHNVYFVDDSAVPPGSPRTTQGSSKHNIAGDLIAGDALIRKVYEYEPLRRFTAAVVGEERLYLQADPLSSLNIMIFGAGDRFGWHFDRTPYSVTILLQPPEQGGVFEYVPYLRPRREADYDENVNEQVVGAPEDENFEVLASVLAGERKHVVDVDLQAGTMLILLGRHSLHRVTEIAGPRPRIQSILAYEPAPGVVFNDETRIRFYGRAR